jgi:hypothetical protein
MTMMDRMMIRKRIPAIGPCDAQQSSPSYHASANCLSAKRYPKRDKRLEYAIKSIKITKDVLYHLLDSFRLEKNLCSKKTK